MNRKIIAAATLMLLVVMSLASCSDNDDDKTAGKVRQLQEPSCPSPSCSCGAEG